MSDTPTPVGGSLHIGEEEVYFNTNSSRTVRITDQQGLVHEYVDFDSDRKTEQEINKMAERAVERQMQKGKAAASSSQQSPPKEKGILKKIEQALEEATSIEDAKPHILNMIHNERLKEKTKRKINREKQKVKKLKVAEEQKRILSGGKVVKAKISLNVNTMQKKTQLRLPLEMDGY